MKIGKNTISTKLMSAIHKRGKKPCEEQSPAGTRSEGHKNFEMCEVLVADCRTRFGGTVHCIVLPDGVEAEQRKYRVRDKYGTEVYCQIGYVNNSLPEGQKALLEYPNALVVLHSYENGAKVILTKKEDAAMRALSRMMEHLLNLGLGDMQCDDAPPVAVETITANRCTYGKVSHIFNEPHATNRRDEMASTLTDELFVVQVEAIGSAEKIRYGLIELK